ncbi:hypothetical protein GCM10007160_03970 [Litchfieldella qijiaojingensis]|uniref:Phage late control D family protein n=1 Tax=Litchfieldella qijiaojingensis TaxID=980347 RepID=A0ABQ2YCE9_9GAMM|nr:hypothetical protein [Halomonas qijiaojingensis]GGX79769.1 hypothetical protein GCM10007160_03970 [Halomonas qijiaojingensis]
MPTELRIYLDNQAADEELLYRFREVRVDLAMGIAAEAELKLEIGADDNGHWEGIEEDYTQPFSRVRVEVKPPNGDDFEALIDGPIVGQRFTLSASPNQSQLVLVVHDDSVLLNQHESIVLYEELTASDIATQIFGEFDLIPDVDAVPASGGSLERFVMQRGTAVHLLRKLARQHGLFFYVRPGIEPGSSVGVFKAPDLTLAGYPELLLMGGKRNINKFEAEYDALRPMSARASDIDLADKSVLEAEAATSTLDALGDTATHDIADPGSSFLTLTREDSGDLEAGVNAVADYSSWAYRAEVEVAADVYPAVLKPYNVIAVAGPGGFLGGEYLISRVTHTLDDEGYRQQLTLRRNARSVGSGGGGALGGVF